MERGGKFGGGVHHGPEHGAGTRGADDGELERAGVASRGLLGAVQRVEGQRPGGIGPAGQKAGAIGEADHGGNAADADADPDAVKVFATVV